MRYLSGGPDRDDGRERGLSMYCDRKGAWGIKFSVFPG